MTADRARSLLHYRLLEKIGEGGMGEVWRATDTTLDRDVAIKVLPAAFTSDPDRLARFEPEAKVLASLNHPHIAAIHGLHEDGGTRFLSMELVPGEDLSARIARGPAAIEDALAIGVPIRCRSSRGRGPFHQCSGRRRAPPRMLALGRRRRIHDRGCSSGGRTRA